MVNNGKKSISGLIKELKNEFYRITFLDREKTKKQTIAVVISSVILAVIIAIFDYLFKNGLDILVKL